MTLFKNLFIGFILFCSSSTCFAIGGQLLDPSEIPKSLCKIEFKEKGETGSCSGVLISPNQVMTAEHCLISDTSELYVPLKKYRIQCGDETFKVESSLKNDENAMLLKRLMNGANTIATQSQAVSSDVVILNLKKNSNTPFMNHLSGFETQLKFFDHGILRENVECRFAGNATGPKSAVFEIGGTSNYQLKVIQGFHSVLLHQPESFPVDQESFQIRDGIREAKAYVQEGDSGGPVYCKETTDKNWYLIGVISMGKHDFLENDSFTIMKVAAIWSSALEL